MGWTDALLGTLFTWAVTALGAALVFVIPKSQNAAGEKKLLDISYGFAGGVMLAASYWSLLAPALEMAENDLGYGASMAWVPAAIGFLLGALFVWLGDEFTSDDHLASFGAFFGAPGTGSGSGRNHRDDADAAAQVEAGSAGVSAGAGAMRRRGAGGDGGGGGGGGAAGLGQLRSPGDPEGDTAKQRLSRMKIRRVLLLVLAITVHNFPEGMAVGFGFGAVPAVHDGVRANRRMYDKAWNLAIGIGIQNFPEGFAVSVPLYREGMSKRNAFLAGQASGLVEPIAGLLGYFLVSIVRELLPCVAKQRY